MLVIKNTKFSLLGVFLLLQLLSVNYAHPTALSSEIIEQIINESETRISVKESSSEHTTKQAGPEPEEVKVPYTHPTASSSEIIKQRINENETKISVEDSSSEHTTKQAGPEPVEVKVPYTHPTASSTEIIVESINDSATRISAVESSSGSTTKQVEPVMEVKVPEFETKTETKSNIITDAEYEFRKEYGKLMLTYMNQSVDPCDDFYEYACGNWKNVKLDHQTSHKRNNLLDIVYKLSESMENLLEKSATELKLDYVDELKLAQQFYQACLNADLFPMSASDDYLRIIKSIGGFPAVDATWNASTFSWFNMSAHLSNYGAAGFVYEEILPEYPFAPYFKMPELGFDYIVHSDNIQTNETRGYKLNERRMREYLSSYSVDEKKITNVIEEIFDFWHEVLSLTDRFEEDQDKCQTLSLRTSPTPYFSQWSNYFEIAWLGKEFDLREDDCPCDYFYVELDKICERHKEAVANYLAMKFLYQMDARLKAARYQKDYCLISIQYSLPFLLDKLYLLEYFNDEIRSEVALIVKELRKSLRNILEHADWLDDVTRSEALMKESTIISRIGNFKAPELTERLIREMNNLTFIEGSYAQNNMNLKRFKRFMKRFNGLHHEQLSNTTKPLELLVGSQVNAFYYNVDNSINVMAGILHPPAYHKYWPNSLKYGTIGYLIGHEFTHGFDTVGSMYDSNGDVRNWWSKKSGSVFNDRANCYVDHYNGYLIPEINRRINGNQTKDENIADGGGLREALSAYRRHMKQLTSTLEEPISQKDEQMPGLDLSPEQIFFLGFAQVWCAAYEEEHYWDELTNEHTMDKYRVLGALTNNDDFAVVYNCSLGSEMNPKADKCRVW